MLEPKEDRRLRERATFPGLRRPRSFAAAPALAAAGLAAICLCAASAGAQEVPEADAGRLQRELDRAVAEKSLVGLVVVRSRECARPVLETLREIRVSRLLSGCRLLLVALDRQPEMAARLEPRRFPVVVFLSGPGKEAGRIYGSTDPARFADEAAELFADLRCRGSGDPASLGGGGASDPRSLVSAGKAAWSAGDRFQAASIFGEALHLVEARRSVVGGSHAGRSGAVAAAGRSTPWAQPAAQAHIHLARHAFSSGKFDEAEGHYRSALEELAGAGGPRPEDGAALHARALLGLALAQRALGRTAEGGDALSRALDGAERGLVLAGPARERALYLLAQILRERGKAQEARERFQECAGEFHSGRYGQRARRYLVDEGDADARPSASR